MIIYIYIFFFNQSTTSTMSLLNTRSWWYHLTSNNYVNPNLSDVTEPEAVQDLTQIRKREPGLLPKSVLVNYLQLPSAHISDCKHLLLHLLSEGCNVTRCGAVCCDKLRAVHLDLSSVVASKGLLSMCMKAGSPGASQTQHLYLFHAHTGQYLEFLMTSRWTTYPSDEHSVLDEHTQMRRAFSVQFTSTSLRPCSR